MLVGNATSKRVCVFPLLLVVLLSGYLKRLKQISMLVDKAKRNLDKEVNNESLIGLSRLQDSLTYFTTSIRGNENLLQKLKFKLQIDELDADLIEDVNIEMT